MKRGGQQPGGVRVALMRALAAGACGTLEVLMVKAGISAALKDKARTALSHLRRAGLVVVRGVVDFVAQVKRPVGRPLVVYGPPMAVAGQSAVLDVLGFARQVWR
jgi:hypothetical protein